MEEKQEKMVKQKTFIITIVIFIFLFLATTIILNVYYQTKIKEIVKQKESIVIIRDDEVTGLENVIVE